MQIDANISKIYREKVAKLGKNQFLNQIAEDFLVEAINYPGKIRSKDIRIGLGSEADMAVVGKMTCLAYGWRYGDPRKGAHVDANFAGVNGANMKTIVAKVHHGSCEMVLATARLVRGELEIPKFFNFTDGRTWEEYFAGRPAYEVERLAFHPVFELLGLREVQMQIVRDFSPVIYSLIPEANAWLGCVLRDNVKRFLDMTGFKVRKIEHLQFADNDYTRMHLKLNPRYFQNFYAYTLN